MVPFSSCATRRFGYSSDVLLMPGADRSIVRDCVKCHIPFCKQLRTLLNKLVCTYGLAMLILGWEEVITRVDAVCEIAIVLSFSAKYCSS